MAEEFINIKNAPSRTLSHVIGHDANGKGGRQSVEDIAPRLVVRPEDFGAAGDANPSDGSGTIDNQAFEDAITALYEAGGGVLQLSRKCYRLEGDLVLPNDGFSSPAASQPPIRITGAGHHCSGQGSPPVGGSILKWTDGGDAPGRITSYGLGTLVADNFTMLSREGTAAGNGRGFFYTTNTTLKAEKTTAWTQKQYGNCDDDFWIAGGTTKTIDNTADAPFQGYGSLVQNNFFQGIRRGLYGRVYFNANRFILNTFWNRCGSNLETNERSPVEIDGYPGGAEADFAVGNLVAYNLFEVRTHYDYGVILRQAANTHVIGNDAYDSSSQYKAMVRITDGCAATYAIAGQNDGKPYVINEGLPRDLMLLSAEYTTKSHFSSISAGATGYPNRFGPSVFDGGTGNNALSVKPAAYSGAESSLTFRVQRADDAPTRAGETVFAVEQGGTMAHPLMVRYRTVANLPPAADWPRAIVAVSNGDSGAFCLAVSNGSSWLRIPVGSPVSET